MMLYIRSACVLLCLLCLTPFVGNHLFAQEPDIESDSEPSVEMAANAVPSVSALRVDLAPRLDGEVLGDAAYADATPAAGFMQNRPFEGEPASERTEVRIVYTSDTLYFGVVCFTNDPNTIISADSRRDSDLTETDSFRVILDTYLDGQNGFIFGTNPAGVEYDGQITNEGQGTGRFGGGGSGRPSNNRHWKTHGNDLRYASSHLCF